MGRPSRLGGNNSLVVDGSKETTKIEVDLLDNGKEISNGPNNLGMVIGRQDWSSQQGWTSRSTYRDSGSQQQWRDQQAHKPMAARLDSANSGPTIVTARTGWLAESTGWTTTTCYDSSSTMDCTAATTAVAYITSTCVSTRNATNKCTSTTRSGSN